MSKVEQGRKREMIKAKLAQVLTKSSSNPLFEGVTVVDIKLSPDSASAVVFFSVFGKQDRIDAITEALNKAAGFFQARLSKHLPFRNTPRLTFVYDVGFDHASHIDVILKEIKDES